jgi:hypothetical protein
LEGWLVSWWLPDPTIPAGEVVTWKKSAALSQDGRSTIGGRLYLTDRTLIWQPSRLNSRTQRAGGQRAYQLQSVVRVEKVDRTGTLYDGGLNPRIGITLSDGSSAMFLVRRIEQAVQGVRTGAA